MLAPFRESRMGIFHWEVGLKPLRGTEHGPVANLKNGATDEKCKCEAKEQTEEHTTMMMAQSTQIMSSYHVLRSQECK